MPGIRDAFILEPVMNGTAFLSSGGVAIVADLWWNAQNARKSLKVVWDNGPAGTNNTATFSVPQSRPGGATPSGGQSGIRVFR